MTTGSWKAAQVDQYRGNNASNVSKDAKYSVTVDGKIKLVYRVSNREKELLTTSDHPKLAEMVNDVKVELTGSKGGAFYLNEFGDVLVPDGAGGSIRAGHYEKTLKFDFNGGELTSTAAPGLEPGDVWEGPHPGIKYVLCAGGQDVKYERLNGNRSTEVRLSDDVGESAARETARRIAAIKGSSGGSFYINERCELFAPIQDRNWEFVYVGHLEDSAWFDPPSGYDRA